MNKFAIPLEEAVLEIKLWAPQMAEHALFLHLLLHEPVLKQRAKEVYQDWTFRICSADFHVEEVFPLLDSLEALKTEVLERLQAGEWIGATYPSFVEHIRRELYYFRNKLLGFKLTPEEEAEFWLGIHADHASFAAHLLDPEERALVDQSENTSRELTEAEKMASVVHALEAGVKLTEMNKKVYEKILNNEIRSIIHPDLLHHVIREGEISTAVLSSLNGQDGLIVRGSLLCKHAQL